MKTTLSSSSLVHLPLINHKGIIFFIRPQLIIIIINIGTGSVIIDRTIFANKPNILIVNGPQSSVFLVDVTVPHDESLFKAQTEKRLDLAHDVTHMM